jgi:hypothetical protein
MNLDHDDGCCDCHHPVSACRCLEAEEIGCERCKEQDYTCYECHGSECADNERDEDRDSGEYYPLDYCDSNDAMDEETGFAVGWD